MWRLGRLCFSCFLAGLYTAPPLVVGMHVFNHTNTHIQRGTNGYHSWCFQGCNDLRKGRVRTVASGKFGGGVTQNIYFAVLNEKKMRAYADKISAKCCKKNRFATSRDDIYIFSLSVELYI